MEGVGINMRRSFIIILISIVCCMTVSGCSAGSKKQEESSKTSEVQETADGDKEEVADTSDEVETETNELIAYTYRNNPMSLRDPATDGVLI